jgi:serine/threonine-protein kinase
MSYVRLFEPELGSVLGKYELLTPVAKGGMAQVWAARKLGTRGYRNVVAVKTILPGVLDQTRLEQMFMQEGVLSPRLRHQNLVRALEFGEHVGVPYLVMEWVEGEPLHVLTADARDHGGIPLAVSCYIVSRALRGLHAAHDLVDDAGAPLGIVHRDISPQNVMVTADGQVKLLDFGVAKATALETSFTDAGEIKGKYAYVSPEQVSGLPLDRRSDVFSAGVLLYMLSTGRHPFRGQSAAETVRKICSSMPSLPPTRLSDDFPPELEQVLMKALEKSPDARFRTAREFADAIERAVPQTATSAREAGEFVLRVSGSRSLDRRRRLRLAEERLERDHSGSGLVTPAASQGSLRALSIEHRESEIIIHAETDESIEALSIGVGRSLPRSSLWRRARSTAFAAALLVSGALVGLGARQLASATPAVALAAQPSPVPATTLERGRVKSSVGAPDERVNQCRRARAERVGQADAVAVDAAAVGSDAKANEVLEPGVVEGREGLGVLEPEACEQRQVRPEHPGRGEHRQ